MDLSSLFLKLLLNDPKGGLESWSSIKKAYLQGFDSVILAISSYYTKHGVLPNFAELEVSNRNAAINTSIAILKDVEVPEGVDIDIVADALLDTFTQDSALGALDKLLDTITLMDSHEIKEELANLSISLEEQTHNSDDVVNMQDLSVITDPEEREAVVDLLFSKEFDTHAGGMGQANLILLGGYRGSGKSILGCNIAVEQYKAGNVGVVFSIEMPATEIFQRYLAMLANVSHRDIRNASLTEVQQLKLAKARCAMFSDGDKALETYLEEGDFPNLERKLQNCRLKTDNQLIIIDNPTISLTQIDLHLYKLKARFGDKLQVAVIDYVNVIQVAEGHSQFDWVAQLELSKGLKSLAAKHSVLIVAPFQTKEDGGIKFSTAILDSPDLVLNMTATEEGMSFETIKSRNIAPLDFFVGIDWNTLTIDPTETKKAEEKREVKALPARKEDDV